jgi:pyruvate dehydrogenase E2 component (dihydrolipoamide acetyltransferase)
LATEVLMPQMGLTQSEGTLIRWYKSQGEAVRQGEAICEIETDKATLDVEAPSTGVLGVRLLEAGMTVPIGYRIAWLVAPGESAPGLAEPPPELEKAPRPATETSSPATPPGRSAAPPASSPAARRLARERGVDLEAVRGSGPGGRILEEDVQRAAAPEPEPERPVEPVRGGRRIELSAVRRVAARRLSTSFQNVPHFYLRVSVDATAVVDRKRRFAAQGVTYTDLFLHAVAVALARHPHVNARWDEDAIWQFDHVDLGLAVHTERGLLVPVIRDAAALKLPDLAARRRQLVERAVAGRLSPEDLEGGTFTVTNLGMHRVDSAWPVINPPQAAILAVGAISPKVMPVDGVAVVRPGVELVLAVDHRVLDGVDAAVFLDDVRLTLEGTDDALLLREGEGA